MDRMDLTLMEGSPSCLLRDLGLEKDIFLFRPTEDPWGEVIPLQCLDDNIIHRGVAHLMRVRRSSDGEVEEGRLLCLECQDKRVLKLVSLQLSATGRFEFGVCYDSSRDPRDIRVTRLRIYTCNGYRLMPFEKSSRLY